VLHEGKQCKCLGGRQPFSTGRGSGPCAQSRQRVTAIVRKRLECWICSLTVLEGRWHWTSPHVRCAKDFGRTRERRGRRIIALP